MLLAEGENKVDELTTRTFTIVLTNHRLSVLHKNTQEHYPLDKVTAIKTKYERNPVQASFGVLLILILVPLLIVGLTRGLYLIALFITGLILVSAFELVWGGYNGETQLIIEQFGGAKVYKTKGQDHRLLRFADAINSALTAAKMR